MYSWIAIAIILFPIQLKTTAPYGRHTNTRWGKIIDNRLGWFLMEIISPLAFAFFFLTGENAKTPPMWFFFGLWIAHYFYRSIIFPFRTKTKGKGIPLAIVAFALAFNVVNGFTNGYYLGSLGLAYPTEWLFDPRFISGTLVFFTGAFINIQSDNILLNLRKPGEKGYKVPQGGLFYRVSCPNYFGEILEWVGFAILTWNIAALGFAIWTASNLIPRALSHHNWYKENFEHYPTTRKAIIPFIW
jgi:protein-S-isoprenylcysteine O-methyltransferase Ste14